MPKQQRGERSHLYRDGNHNWKGGIAEYPNHSHLKRQRLIVLENAEYKCGLCGKKAERVHHIDEDKSNHELSNLQPLCKECHYKKHTGRKNTTSKYMRLYGYNLADIKKKTGLYPTEIKVKSETIEGQNDILWMLKEENG